LDGLDLSTQSRTENLGQTPVNLIDADVDTAVVGDAAAGAQAVFFAANLAIGVAVGRRRQVALIRIESEEIRLL